jgi:hypothetical protein
MECNDSQDSIAIRMTGPFLLVARFKNRAFPGASIFFAAVGARKAVPRPLLIRGDNSQSIKRLGFDGVPRQEK